MCILFVFIAENQINHVFPPRGVARGAGVLQTCKNSKRLQLSVKLWFGRQIKSSEKLKARYNITSFNESTMKRNADQISNIDNNRRIGLRIDQILFLDLELSRPILNSVSFCESGAAQRGQKKMF